MAKHQPKFSPPCRLQNRPFMGKAITQCKRRAPLLLEAPSKKVRTEKDVGDASNEIGDLI